VIFFGFYFSSTS